MLTRYNVPDAMQAGKELFAVSSMFSIIIRLAETIL